MPVINFINIVLVSGTEYSSPKTLMSQQIPKVGTSQPREVVRMAANVARLYLVLAFEKLQLAKQLCFIKVKSSKDILLIFFNQHA
jgi:hypothetical protein